MDGKKGETRIDPRTRRRNRAGTMGGLNSGEKKANFGTSFLLAWEKTSSFPAV